MFINLSNHPSETWSENQLLEALKYGDIIDIPFPSIPTEWTTNQIRILVSEYINKIYEITNGNKEETIIHIMGEAVFCFMIINILTKEGYCVVASTTERNVYYEGNNKVSEFIFKGFRSYN